MKKRIFVSGVTGIMGKKTLKYLLMHLDKLEIVCLIRDSKENRKFVLPYLSQIEVVWGDLLVYSDVLEALSGVDTILHMAALVSPMADYEPVKAFKVNVGSVENLLNAVSELSLSSVKFVYIGSVAELGSRLPPIHWGRVGDPIKASVFDYYALTKIKAERMIIESGLKYWVSLRQTGILHEGLLNNRDGIVFHQALNNVLEWVSDEDSGRMMANLCVFDLPSSFWNRVYNVGGGESCRVDNYEFMSRLLSVVGVKDIKKIFDLNWFSLKNFHGQYYLDSDDLNDVLDFRRDSLDDFLHRLKSNLPYPASMLKYMPSFMIKNLVMKPIAKKAHGSIHWVESKEMAKVDAFFGSMDAWENIGSWQNYLRLVDTLSPVILDHGYNESKLDSELSHSDMKHAGVYRGGRCLSETMIDGDLKTKLDWECAFKHQFKASPYLVLKAGHWCPKCEPPPWNDVAIAEVNPFFDQVWRDN